MAGATRTAKDSTLERLLAGSAGAATARALLDTLELDPAMGAAERRVAEGAVSRASVAMALGGLLFADLLDRVPTGRAYVADVRAAGGRVMLDHGALRTVRFPSGPTGAQPGGREAFARLLAPLGYAEEGVYPLDRLKMTGYVFTHQDFPETLPQYFVSELHVDRFGPAFAAAAERVFGTTTESLGPEALALLETLAARGRCDDAAAIAGLPQLAGAFGRWHDIPSEADYETLLAESAEAAWIATEGSVFNHATDRVPDVEALAAAERARGRPIKDEIEVSTSGRVRQTAFKADPVTRAFRRPDGSTVERVVPGSFYEFIARDPLPDADPGPENGRRLDLRFDSANAQGIFKMTAVERPAS
jgi:hypothetical protein